MTEIKLSDNVLIPCPEKGFGLRKVKNCYLCEYYKGMMKATVNDIPVETNNADDYQVICGRPITRKLIEVSED